MDIDLTPLARALKEAGSEAKLARAVGLSQPAIHKAKKAGRVSPALAIQLERHFSIPRHESRPDLWDAPAHQGAAA